MLTMDTYSHVLPAMHQEIAAQMNRLFEATGDDEKVSGDDEIVRREGADG